MRKGLSMIEGIVAVALLAIVMLMASPMVRSYSLVYNRINLQNRIDYEFEKTLEIIKRKVRAAREDDDNFPSKVAVEVTEDTSVSPKIISELRLVVPNQDVTVDKTFISFRIEEDDDGYRRLYYITNPGGYITTASESKTLLMEHIDQIETGKEYFDYREGVVLVYLDIDVDRMTGESIEGKREILDKVMDAAVTRINIDMSKNY